MARKNLKDGYQQSLRETSDPEKYKVATCIENTAANPIPVTIADGDSGIGDTTANIINKAVATAATEETQALPTDTKKFILKARGKSTVQLSYTSGQSGTLFITIPPGGVYQDANFYSSQTLYFQTSKSGETVEIIAYT